MFTTVEHEWVAMRPSDHWAEEAKRYRESLADRPDHVAYKDDLLWVGKVFEWCFHAWLLEGEHSFKAHGGCDGKPDFEIAHWGVGTKCRTIKKGRMHPEYVVNVPDKHIQRDAEQLLVFGAFELARGRMLILGAISRGRFLRDAEFIDKGEPINPVTKADEATWSIAADTLTPIADVYAYIHETAT